MPVGTAAIYQTLYKIYWRVYIVSRLFKGAVMSLSVLEVLQNAEYNLKNGVMSMQKDIAISQLSNAILQLEENSNADAKFIEAAEQEESPKTVV